MLLNILDSIILVTSSGQKFGLGITKIPKREHPIDAHNHFFISCLNDTFRSNVY